jgi:exopolysaccharide production protein ExoY
VSFEPQEIYPDFSTKTNKDFLPARQTSLYSGSVKRVLDVVLVLLAAPVVLPVVLIIALLVMRDGHSPFYWSERVGRNGRIFRMMKLRTMVHGADERLEAYLASDSKAAAEWAETQKLKRDPRITAFGRILRKSSIDELPQLWNVLIGEMAMVGPRPMMPDQRKIYPGRAYYALRPGVTGPWQVSDRNDCGFAKRADFDLEYHRTLTFMNDLRLLGRTVIVVLRGTGY